MLDQSLIKSNFLGRDGFRWWIGQIPPEGAHGAQLNGGGWGNRYKVRILGYHPYSEVDLPDDDLPWAQVLIPTTSGSGAANCGTDVKLKPGDVVFGFFLDGDNAQVPVIMATFGKTSQTPSDDYQSPFVPFTGYTDKIKKPNGTLKADQTNEQNAETQKSPRHVPQSTATQIDADEISYFMGIGDIIDFASASSDSSSGSTISKISTEVSNILKFIQNLSSYPGLAQDYIDKQIDIQVDKVTQKIQKIISGLVGSSVNSTYMQMAPILNDGLKQLYEEVYALTFAATLSTSAAHLAGVAAQTAMVPPIKTLQDQIPCVVNSIINGIGSVIKDILKSIVANVTNFVSCVADQFIGALVNDIIPKIAAGLEAAIAGVSSILKFFSNFNISDLLRSSSDFLGGLVSGLSCNQTAGNANAPVKQWVIGKGPKDSPGPNLDNILQNANEAAAIASTFLDGASGIQSILNSFDIFGPSTGIPSISSALGGCYSGPPLTCNAPTINIFGSNGSGASAIPVFGSLVGSVGSIIGAVVTNGGSGYDFPPYVDIVDNCNQGYGAVAQSVINTDGEVTGIYFTSEGENYPIGEPGDYTILSVIIVDPGVGYSDTDQVTDNLGNEYKTQIYNGSVINVQPINIVSITDLPILTIKSNTGSGAILKPIFGLKPEFQGEVKQVIDCIT